MVLMELRGGKEMKKLFLLFLIMAFIFVSYNGSYINKKTVLADKTIAKLNTVVQSVPVLDKITAPETVSIIGVGDIMLGSNYPSSSYLPNKNILKNVESITQDTDITFGNLEGTILAKGGTPKSCEECFSFRMPDSYAQYLKEAGFDILSLANNHSCDFGDVGKKNTMAVLKQDGIYFVGLREVPYTVFEKNGVKYGFCAFAPDYSGVMHFDEADKIIKYLDSKCDIIIVSFHTGAEGQNHQHITRSTEYFLGENRGNPYQLAREVIDVGADVVFMEGPHVTRAIDLYKDKFIAYSLGNFATYGRFDISGVCGVSPIIKISVNKKGEFLSGKIYSVKLIERGIPVIDDEKKALKEIINLTKVDTEAKLIIKNDGTIEKRLN